MIIIDVNVWMVRRMAMGWIFVQGLPLNGMPKATGLRHVKEAGSDSQTDAVADFAAWYQPLQSMKVEYGQHIIVANTTNSCECRGLTPVLYARLVAESDVPRWWSAWVAGSAVCLGDVGCPTSCSQPPTSLATPKAKVSGQRSHSPLKTHTTIFTRTT